jgi:uncharacterized DUF497 family protein
VKFEWDPRKAAANLRKHGVSFDEAMTVFADWESVTIPDPDHSEGEERFLIVGSSSARGDRSWLSPTPNGARMSASSARDARMRASGENMANKTKQGQEMRDHYDFSGGVRGKYAARYAEGTNVVVLAPDVAEVFPDSIAVNEALRTLVRMSGKTLRATPAPKKRGG